MLLNGQRGHTTATSLELMLNSLLESLYLLGWPPVQNVGIKGCTEKCVRRAGVHCGRSLTTLHDLTEQPIVDHPCPFALVLTGQELVVSLREREPKMLVQTATKLGLYEEGRGCEEGVDELVCICCAHW